MVSKKKKKESQDEIWKLCNPTFSRYRKKQILMNNKHLHPWRDVTYLWCRYGFKMGQYLPDHSICNGLEFWHKFRIAAIHRIVGIHWNWKEWDSSYSIHTLRAIIHQNFSFLLSPVLTCLRLDQWEMRLLNLFKLFHVESSWKMWG